MINRVRDECNEVVLHDNRVANLQYYKRWWIDEELLPFMSTASARNSVLRIPPSVNGKRMYKESGGAPPDRIAFRHLFNKTLFDDIFNDASFDDLFMCLGIWTDFDRRQLRSRNTAKSLNISHCLCQTNTTMALPAEKWTATTLGL